MNPSISQKERITSLDIIRGLALFGILFINVKEYPTFTEDPIIPNYTGINHLIDTLIPIFIEKKFYSIFSFLFGIGFYIFASRAESRGDKPRWRFTRRLLALFFIGVLQLGPYFGTILPVYAVMGLLLLPFYNASVSTISKWLGGITGIYIVSLILRIAFGDSAFLEYIGNDQTLIFIMLLAGFLVAKADWIRRISELKKPIHWIQLVTLPIFIVFSVWIWAAPDHEATYIIALGTIPTFLFYITTLFLLMENKTVRTLLKPVARVGQMALTNYVSQSMIGLFIISFMGMESPPHMISPVHVVMVACLVFIFHLIVSSIWLTFFKRGPLESIWRLMTYGKQTFK